MLTFVPWGSLGNVHFPPLRKKAPVANASSMNCIYVHRPLRTFAKTENGEVTVLHSTVDRQLDQERVNSDSPKDLFDLFQPNFTFMPKFQKLTMKTAMKLLI